VIEKARIVGVEAIPVLVRGQREFRISEGFADSHTSVVLRIVTDQPGLEGFGESVSAPPGKPEEFAEEIVGAVERYVAPALIGLRVNERRAGRARVEKALKGRIWTKAAVDVALHDLHAKALGVPVTDLLGGRLMDEVPVIGAVIGMAAPDVMARIAAEQAQSGFAAVKIKIGETIAADLARVAAVREAIGPGVRLRVDANDHYRPADAVSLVRAIERYDIEHVEQPVARGDLLGLAELRRSVGVPICSDDAVATPRDAMTLARLGAASRVKVKVSKHGIEGAALIIGMLEAAGVGCVLGHVFQMGLASLAEAQIAACAPNLIPPHEIGSLGAIAADTDIVTNRLRPRPGFFRLANSPGLGAEIDWPAIERCRTDLAGRSRPRVTPA
jgi:L-alanine-DL-glutamate epimerase-like enolase superfamily enzyme